MKCEIRSCNNELKEDSIRCGYEICGPCRNNMMCECGNKINRQSHIDICQPCYRKIVPINHPPQRTKAFWTDEKKKEHGNAVRNSEKYQNAIKIRDTSGPKNSMYHKKHSIATRNKMSISRTGKTGKNATAWKGGRFHTLTVKVKIEVSRRFKWYNKMYAAYDKCSKCGSKEQLDAHHIVPMVILIKEELAKCNIVFDCDDDKAAYLANCDRIKDENLLNGLILCRKCHKEIHNNWGSRFNP